MKIASVVNNDLANGPGIRTSIFVSGCPLHCEGCHNKDLWSYDIGTDLTDEVIDKIIEALTKDGIQRDLSILGGEPLSAPNLEGLSEMLKKIKQILPNIEIWLWTGYEMEYISKAKSLYIGEIFQNIDVIIDGPFKIDQKTGNHVWRGSANQRIWRKNDFGDFETVVKE